jgi:hypothetical protein
MTDLEILQLLIILIVLYWIVMGLKRKSKFMTNSIVPWNFNLEKNKVYVFTKDPLDFDLGLMYSTASTSPIVRYDESKGFNTLQYPTMIQIDEETRLDLLNTVDSFVKFQNYIADDLAIIQKNLIQLTTKNMSFDYSSVMKMNLQDISKYKMLSTGKETGNLLTCGDFTTTYNVDGSIQMSPEYAWETSEPLTGQSVSSLIQNAVKTILHYPARGDIPTELNDQSNVKFMTGKFDNSFPPNMYDSKESMGAVLTFINFKRLLDSINRLPYIRQDVYLKKDVVYSLNYFYYGFVPLFINVYSNTTKAKVFTGTHNDVSYVSTWLYKKINFTVPFDGYYKIEFTMNINGNETLYPGTDPEGRKYIYNGRVMLQNIVLESDDSKNQYSTQYSLMNFSKNIDDLGSIYIVMNGKSLRMNMYVTDDINAANKRRSQISEFLNKTYIS